MIGILDYGLGNIKAFQNIYREHGIELKVISNYKDFSKNFSLGGETRLNYAFDTSDEKTSIIDFSTHLFFRFYK